MRSVRIVQIAALLFASTLALGQGFRFDNFSWTTTPVGINPVNVVAILPNAVLAVCAHPGNAVPCTNYATTYTDATLGTPCANNAQVVLQGTSSCVATADALGNFGAWVAPGVQYDYTLTVGANSYGPYTVTAPVTTTGTLTLTNKTLTSPTVTNPATTGTDAGAETLQNKVLNGMGSGNSVSLLNTQGPASAIVGTGAAATLYTYTIPANTVGPGKCIRLRMQWIHSTGTASVTYALSLAGSAVESIGWTNGNTILSDVETYLICNNPGVQNAQYWTRESLLNRPGPIFDPGSATGTFAADLSQAQILKETFSVPNTDQVTPKFWFLELVQ